MIPRIVLTLATMLLSAGPRVASADPRLDHLIDRVDDLWRGQSSHGVFSMRVVTANYTREMQMEVWSKGKDYSLVRILKPQKEKDTATLKAKKELYTYLPKTDRTIRLTSGMMMGSWMGSHFTNDDLVKESRLLNDYTAQLSFEGERAGQKVIEITLLPKPDAPVVWGKVVLLIEAIKELPISQTYYDEDQKVARTMTLSDIKVLGGREMPTHLKMVPADKPTELTELTYESMKFDVGLEASFFSLGKIRER